MKKGDRVAATAFLISRVDESRQWPSITAPTDPQT